MHSFKAMSIKDFGVCFRAIHSIAQDCSDLIISEAYDTYLRDRGNTIGCPKLNIRRDLEISCSERRCHECWNMCLNTQYEKEGLGGFWNV